MKMTKLNKSKTIETISLESLRKYTTINCIPLVVEIGKVLGLNLKNYCKVKSLTHYYELKAIINNINSTVSVKASEKAGRALEWKNESQEIQSFLCTQLKSNATQRCTTKAGIEFNGILHGTIKSHECSPTETCPVCGGTGTCSTCNGNKKIVCPICDGEIQCVACEGTGIYTCRHCGGTGTCPDCGGDGEVTCPDCDGNGVITCPDCDGEGVVTCPDCDGWGNYIDESCNNCGGTGYSDWGNNKKCHVCNGTGRYVVKCRRCKGKGTIRCWECGGEGTVECERCDGEGIIKCRKCNGSGSCSHCHGEGGFKCKACGGTGVCGKCKGKGEIWCPDCHGTGICSTCKGEKLVKCSRCNGTGVYQTFTEYTLIESSTVKELCSFTDIDFNKISGDLCYNDIVYDFSANKANIYNLEEVVNTAGVCTNVLKEWLALDKNTVFINNNLANDYFQLNLELYKIPITKIVFECNSKKYTIWVVGNDKIIFYDKMPNLGDKIWGRFKNLFS